MQIFSLFYYIRRNKGRFGFTKGEFITPEGDFDRVAQRSPFAHVNFDARRNAHIEKATFDFSFAGYAFDYSAFTKLEAV